MFFWKPSLSFPVSENITVSLMDRYRFNGIILTENIFHGDEVVDNMGNYDYFTYNIDIIATEQDSRDPGADCQDYGVGKKFETLKECFAKKAEEDFSYLGCTLPWLTDDEDKICTPNTPNINNSIQKGKKSYKH